MPEVGDYIKNPTTGKIEKVVEVPSWDEPVFKVDLDKDKSELARLQKLIEGLPIKHKPDIETLEYWNKFLYQQRDDWQVEIDRLTAVIAKKEEALITAITEK